MTDTSLALRTRRPRPFALVVAAASVPMFMATLDNLVMTNALPVLHSEMGASVEELQWFVNAYTLAFASAILIASALGDRFGRRTLFAIGIAVFGAGSVLAALSTDPGQLIAARAVQGLGAAGVMPLSLALLSGAVPPARRALAIGIWGGVSGLGVAVGPLVGGAIMEGWDWQAIFWINVPVALIAIPLALVVLNNDFGARARIDVPGAVLAAARRAGARARDRARERRRLGLARRHRRDRRRRAPDRRVPGVAAAREGPADAAAAVPRPLVLDHERRRLRVQLRHLRLGVHPHPVPAGRAGLDPARGRRADHAVDARADDRRPDRRHPRPPRRHAGAAGARPRPAGCRADAGSRRSCRPTSTTRRSSSRS